MKIRGTLLTFDKVYRPPCYPHMFTKDTNFTIPEKIPLIWNFKTNDPESVLGNVKAFVTEKGISIEGDIFDESIPKHIDPFWGLGGFYNRLAKHKKDDIYIIDEANVATVSIVPNPISDDLGFEIFKEENKE